MLFIFCTTDPSQIRPAVVSRLQRFTFRPLPEPADRRASSAASLKRRAASVTDDAIDADRAARRRRHARRRVDARPGPLERRRADRRRHGARPARPRRRAAVDALHWRPGQRPLRWTASAARSAGGARSRPGGLRRPGGRAASREIVVGGLAVPPTVRRHRQSSWPRWPGASPSLTPTARCAGGFRFQLELLLFRSTRADLAGRHRCHGLAERRRWHRRPRPPAAAEPSTCCPIRRPHQGRRDAGPILEAPPGDRRRGAGRRGRAGLRRILVRIDARRGEPGRLRRLPHRPRGQLEPNGDEALGRSARWLARPGRPRLAEPGQSSAHRGRPAGRGQ